MKILSRVCRSLQARSRHVYDGLMCFLFPKRYPYALYLKRVNDWLEAQDLKDFDATHLDSKDELTDAEKSAIVKTWRQYFSGKIYFDAWRLQKRLTGRVDAQLVPSYIWFGYVLPNISNYIYDVACSDKGMYGFYFKDFCRPKEIVRNVNGAYFDSYNNNITEQEAVSIVLEYGKPMVVKQSVDSCGGKNVRVAHCLSRQDVFSLFQVYETNFVFQEKIEQHDELAQFNKSSLNTLRVTTAFLNGRISVLRVNLRHGLEGSCVDNVAAGGRIVGVDLSGKVSSFAVGVKGIKSTHLTDTIAYGNITLTVLQSVLEFASKLHSKMPFCPLVGWDISVTKSGEPIFVEMNAVNTGIFTEQVTTGPLLADRFDEIMLRVVSSHKMRWVGGGGKWIAI